MGNGGETRFAYTGPECGLWEVLAHTLHVIVTPGGAANTMLHVPDSVPFFWVGVRQSKLSFFANVPITVTDYTLVLT